MDKRRQHLRAAVVTFASATLLLPCPVVAQQPAPAPAPQSQAAAHAQSPAPSGAPIVLSSAEQSADATSLSEEELRRQLQGKTFYLRRGYLGDALHFNETGLLDGSAPAASYALSLVEIDRVHLEKHRLELVCVRYGLHFLGALTTEDQTQAVDRVRLTSKKKPLRITIDREQVSNPKKAKDRKHGRSGSGPTARATIHSADDTGNAPPLANQPVVPIGRSSPAITSQSQANIALAKALDNVFAAAIDERMITTLPEYWRLFYQSAAEHRLYRPADPSILRDSDVDQKAKLIAMAAPQSNDYAQKNGVAGMAMYSVVVGADGKAEQIAVGRPIGFGLDENAVAAIQKATFQPALKNGRPVPVLLDLVVQFRIYSKLTEKSAANSPPGAQGPVLPGPYTANMPLPQPQPAAEAVEQPNTAAPSGDPASAPTSSAPAAQPSQSSPTRPENTPY